jgi:UDP-N-acetylglucosamine 2-epimerase (non-hydrolysing)
MHILHVVGARPNFMKAAPVVTALLKRAGINQTLVHTGQHYDRNMSYVFVEQLGIPAPDVNLGGRLRLARAADLGDHAPVRTGGPGAKADLVLVYGDVNSTMAAALVCSKLLVRVGHGEAGCWWLTAATPLTASPRRTSCAARPSNLWLFT